MKMNLQQQVDFLRCHDEQQLLQESDLKEFILLTICLECEDGQVKI
jgi:hypothetical protein